MCEGMNPKPELEGHVVSIHLHATTGRAPLRAVESVEAVTDKGLRGDARYFGRRSRSTGGPSRRQVTLIGREVLERHADVLGIPAIPPGVARSNIETLGVGWRAWSGSGWPWGMRCWRWWNTGRPASRWKRSRRGCGH